MGRFAGDPEFTLRWPPSLLRKELRRLIDRARREGMTRDWQGEVELLLRQAFRSPVPQEDFGSLVNGVKVLDDDEPF
jgi:hypothetical protein